MEVEEAELKVRLLAHTPNPEQVVAKAAKLCYSDSDIDELFKKIGKEDQGKFIDMLVSRGHLSPIEHASYTIAVEGISRACSHELVRHRLASYSQQSQRYVKYKNPRFVVPPDIGKDTKSKKMFLEDCLLQYKKYKSHLEEGKKAEDARFLLPNAMETKIIITMNARELLHVFRLRCCERAQWEIRSMAKEILKLVYPTAPNIFKYAGPSCLRGACSELDHKCPRPIPEIREEFKKILKS